MWDTLEVIGETILMIVLGLASVFLFPILVAMTLDGIAKLIGWAYKKMGG